MNGRLPSIQQQDTVTTQFLDAFAAAWCRHDTDAILAAMTSDCVFQQSVGTTVDGIRATGQSAVRLAIDSVFATFPDALWNDASHFIAGDRGVSEWTFTATGTAGRIEVLGCDLFTFRDGLIAVKNSFRKSRTT